MPYLEPQRSFSFQFKPKLPSIQIEMFDSRQLLRKGTEKMWNGFMKNVNDENECVPIRALKCVFLSSNKLAQVRSTLMPLTSALITHAKCNDSTDKGKVVLDNSIFSWFEWKFIPTKLCPHLLFKLGDCLTCYRLVLCFFTKN